MLVSLIAAAVVVAVWSLLARKLERWRLTAPMILVLAGVGVGFGTHGELAATLNTDDAQHAAEMILAVLLFVDATDVRGGFFGRDPRSAMRALFIGLPLSLGLAVLVGLWLLPGLPWPVLLVTACVVVPIDFAPAAAVLRDGRVPQRVRNLLNVEAGYNDGIVSPIFLFALVLAGDYSHAATPMAALGSAVPQALKAAAVGVCIGALLAVATNAAERRDLMTAQSKRLILVVMPVLTYAVSIGIGGNGFVAAFICGITANLLRQSPDIRVELELLDDVSFLLSAVMWFVFGGTAVLAVLYGVPWKAVVFCLLALTVVRIVPMLLALLGSAFTWPERLLIGCLGPRGTTSIVFGLLAFNVLPDQAETTMLVTMVLTVAGSVILHGFGAPAAARAFASRESPPPPN